jgi:uncharacterized protein YaiI (UPF0178 family)
MAWTTTDLTALEAAIASGARTVSHNGKTVTYNSLNEMLKLRDRMQWEIANGSAGRPQAHYVEFRRTRPRS